MLTSDMINVQRVMIVLFSMMVCGFNAGLLIPNIPTFATAKAAARKIVQTIKRESPIDALETSGRHIDNLRGEIELRNVSFAYPGRPEVPILDDINLVCPAGKTTALVGASGSGKSTIVGLIERFYMPYAGQVLLDGVSLQELNVRWLRQHIALVKQEPVLFAGSVRENVEMGLVGSDAEHASAEEKGQLIEKACKLANAHDFIMQLPGCYDAQIGEGAALLSGGKTRLPIMIVRLRGSAIMMNLI